MESSSSPAWIETKYLYKYRVPFFILWFLLAGLYVTVFFGFSLLDIFGDVHVDIMGGTSWSWVGESERVCVDEIGWGEEDKCKVS